VSIDVPDLVARPFALDPPGDGLRRWLLPLDVANRYRVR
jgi:hypothetical protein